MLPAPCFWIDSDDGSFLQWNSITVAIVRPDGAVTLQWRGRRIEGKVSSLAKGKLYAGRWVAAQDTFPGLSKRSWREAPTRDRGAFR